MEDSKFQLIFNLEEILSTPDVQGDMLEDEEHLVYYVEEIRDKVVKTLNEFDGFDQSTGFSSHGNIDLLIEDVETQFQNMIDSIVYKESDGNCPILPPWGGDYLMSFTFKNVCFGYFVGEGSHSIFKKSTIDYRDDEKLNMKVNSWVIEDKKSYTYEKGELKSTSNSPFLNDKANNIIF